jgi:two-component system cell cycle sensor histidine kinase PleC
VLGPIENESYKEYAGDIHRSGQHLLNLINEILDLSASRPGVTNSTRNALSLADIVEDCIGLCSSRPAEEHPHHRGVRGKPADGLGRREIHAPGGAQPSLQRGQVHAFGRGNPVKLGWTAGGGQYLSIKDNGPGIAEDEIPVVLSAFGQGSIAIKSAEQGTGLGLPIVQAILAMHGGEFVLKSKLREGTEGMAILPRNRVLDELPWRRWKASPAAQSQKKRAFA